MLKFKDTGSCGMDEGVDICIVLMFCKTSN